MSSYCIAVIVRIVKMKFPTACYYIYRRNLSEIISSFMITLTEQLLHFPISRHLFLEKASTKNKILLLKSPAAMITLLKFIVKQLTVINSINHLEHVFLVCENI